MDKYKALRTLSSIIGYIAWIEIIAVIIIIGVYFHNKVFATQIVVSTTLGGLVSFILLLAFSKLIVLVLDIRESQLTNNIANATGNIDDDIEQIGQISQANIIKLADLIKKQKKGLFGSSNKTELIEFLNSMVDSKADCLKIIELYKSLNDSDIINDLKSLSSSYSAIKENLTCFIEYKIVGEDYPHEIIKDE